ncbi:Carboxymuconolactone decarboxylase [Beutenbergia cavernae DSM 12333]|uniref:Carboxymuconolactone decarboxylase n=1 Tax=Beutenbergia cavernae (strain ATCC BAA-8 / DSM 12333 / CCUG 43141 / JCM 11478 / NBRC 16432 / NCIMB 13614 / HKI 0122) TaxID=471853 RepID=C5BW91_BEUC1|nr:carboxymuconolactone decarboxylase family protein [Beutenbergia cavernae]ACQ78549.1 Carboxymuconolactone decarboxylase [Beutenbergia cavernae DSM 12333]
MSTTRVPPTEITGPLGWLVKTMGRRMMGEVPESAGVMWHHPAVFKDLMGLGRKSEKWGRLDENLSVYASMAAAAEVGCSACLDYHYFMTRHKHLDEAKAREVPRWRSSDVFTPTERRVMEYAEAMCQIPVAVTDEMSAALLDDLGPAGLIELTTKVGLMNATARSNIALGIRSQEFAASCGLPPLASRPATDPAGQPNVTAHPVAG